jgi:hypothetical protein
VNDLETIVFDAQDQSLTLMEALFERMGVCDVDFTELAARTELDADSLERCILLGAPDEMDVDALVRVAIALGWRVSLGY